VIGWARTPADHSLSHFSIESFILAKAKARRLLLRGSHGFVAFLAGDAPGLATTDDSATQVQSRTSGFLAGGGLKRFETRRTALMKFQPLGDRVVVEREEAKATTAGGIVLPDTAKDRPQKGKVVAVGDGRVAKDGKRKPLQVKVGDSVLFTSYAGEEFKLDGDQKVLLMREDDILAIFE
jgi:chaperonin GroES